MKQRLLWKLLLINIVPVIAVIFLVIWLAIDQLAANYFMALMNKYEVSPTDIHQMFVASIHRYLIWASLASLALAFLLSYLLTRRVLRPLSQMTAITRDVAGGNFSARVEVSSQDEVGELGLSFNRMADSLAKMETLRKTMVADVAHELRTPLTNLRGYLEALTDGVIPPAPETFLMLQEEILRLVQLVENLQQLAKAESATAYLDKKPLQLPELIGQMLTLYKPNFQAKDLKITTRCDSDSREVRADRSKLLQAIRNIIENAWKYTPPEGSISITCAQEGPAMKISVMNTGSTIAETDLPLIFERFYRADRSRSREIGGAGIGLAIVKEIIEAHGGQVGAQSDAHQTSIWFSLPV